MRIGQVLLALLLVPCAAAAEVYQYHPKSPLRLGGGFDPLQADRGFPDCLVTATPVELSGGPPETTFDAKLIKTRKELYHHLQIDASLSASYGLFSASASFSLDHEYSFSENDVLWALRASTDYGRYALTMPELTPAAKRLAKDPEAFAKRCGKEYVSQERRLVHVVALFHFHNLTESERRHVEASLDASYAGGSLGVAMDLDEITNSLKAIYQVKVSVYAIGGEGVTKIKELTRKDDLSEVRDILAEYVQGLSRERATPVEFLTSSWQTLGVDVDPPVMHFRRVALSEHYFLFRDTQTRLEAYGERLRTLISRPQTSPQTTQEIATYQALYSSLSDRLRRIQQRGLDCLREPESLCKLDMNFDSLPQVPAAQYEDVWTDRDQFGNPYYIDVFYENSHLPARLDFHLALTLGDTAENRSVRIKAIQPIGAFPPSTENMGDFIENDRRTSRIVRHPNGDAQQETRRIFYEVLQRRCVRLCFGES